MRTRTATLLLLLLVALPAALRAQAPTPMPGTSVHDFAGVIPDDKEAEIDAKARRLKEEFKTEIAVVVVDSLQGEDSFSYSMKMARSWGIGAEEEGSRGLLILVSVSDRKTAFRTSRHTEGELPDSATAAISREMGEYFKRGDFGGGLSLGMDRVNERVAKGFDPATARPTAAAAEGGGSWAWLLLLLPAGALVLLVWGLRRRKAARDAGAQPLTASAPKAEAARPGPSPATPTGKKKGRRKIKNQPKGTGRGRQQARPDASGYASSSDYSSYGSGSSSDYSSASSGSSSSSSSDYSSSSSDSGSSYGGSSDFGGGGSDSSW